ncbi:gamma-glutamyltransferase [Cerasicoccus arenae]|nr:gamma-glutamyltransferase [Cerasicoccus arenae]MBK1858288.1 gamma-glutamyltransferase [Cerasicoccus arenae]
MVTSSSFEATMAGLDVLRKGGNAFDAAVVVQFVLTVTEPYASGIGGGLFAVAYDSKEEEVFTLDGRETAPDAAEPDLFVGINGKVDKFSSRIDGGRAAGVPGTLAALAYLLDEYGTISMAEAVEPAARIAETGFIITEPFARNLAAHWRRLSKFPETQKLFSRPGGGPLQAGDICRNPELAATLRLIGREGVSVFYKGPIAQDIVATVNESKENPGAMSMADLADYKPIRREPVVSNYRGYTICGMDMPSSGGASLALMLNMLESQGAAFNGEWTAEQLHTLIDVQNLAFADRNAFMADSDFVSVPTDVLISKSYAQKRIGELKPNQGLSTPVSAGNPYKGVATTNATREESPYTTHFTIVDKNRNILSITSTLEQHFGCGLLVENRGFLLNNEMTDFNAHAKDSDGELTPNAPQGGKRPRSSMSPTIVLRDGKPVLALGSPGGSRIIGVTLNVLLNVFDRELELQEAINAPRVVARNRDPEIESPLYRDQALKESLEGMGYQLIDSQAVGSVQAIRINDSGWLEGAADPRREGLALGY